MPLARTSLSVAAALAAALGAAGPAEACTVTATPVAFGMYDSLSPVPLDGVGAVTLRCHPNIHTPQVEASQGSSGNFAVRTMTKGGELLNYNLYTSAARLIVLGDGTGGSSTITAGDGIVTAGTRTIDVPIYGRVFPLQSVGEGTYGDTLFVTVTF